MSIFVPGKNMNAATRLSGDAVSMTEEVMFKFQDLEITRDRMVMHFFEEKTVIPLKKIASYDLKWYLHDPIFAKKCWFLVLTVELTGGGEESAPIAVAKFNYIDDERELREHIANKIAHALDLALSWRSAVLQKMNRFQQDGADVAFSSQPKLN